MVCWAKLSTKKLPPKTKKHNANRPPDLNSIAFKPQKYLQLFRVLEKVIKRPTYRTIFYAQRIPTTLVLWPHKL
jgi:hypothetical protein